jgi:hypothetical protein
MQRLLSNSDIEPYVGRVLVYEELRDLSAQELLDMLPVAILYQQTKNTGHWTALLKTPDGITFFDSYGYIVDSEFKELEYKQPHYLAELLVELSNIVQINYNQYRFQEMKEGVNTCGRWVLLRIWLADMTTDQFYRAVLKTCKKLKITTDQLVVKVTSG